MSNSKRRHRGNDATQRFLRSQHEQREADFAALEARYRRESYTLTDGSTIQIIADNREAPRDYQRALPAPLPTHIGHETDDDLLDLVCAHGLHVAEEQTQRLEDEAEMKQALRDRGVTFAREPKSIHASVPAGRIGSIPRPKAPTKKPDGNGGTVKLWPGNDAKRLNPYIHRFHGTGDK